MLKKSKKGFTLLVGTYSGQLLLYLIEEICFKTQRNEIRGSWSNVKIANFLPCGISDAKRAHMKRGRLTDLKLDRSSPI